MTDKNPFAPPDPNRPPIRRQLPPPSKKPQVPWEPPSVEKLKDLRSRTWRFLAALFAFFLASGLPIPLQVIAPIIGVFAVYFGVRVVRAHIAIKLPGLGLPMALMGLMLCMYLLFGSVSNLVLWNEQVDRQECLSGAITHSAQDKCITEFNEAVKDRLGSFAR